MTPAEAFDEGAAGAPACPDCKKMRPKRIPKVLVIAPDEELDLPF